jgi:predicted ATPase/DNA-binding SARP family transcriptional activator/Tfp pilus assembly protein PilF
MRRTQFGVLGPLSMTSDGAGVALGSRKRRALLAVLLLEPNRVVSRDRLIDALWGEDPPETARNTLQVYVSQLRKLLPEGALETVAPGYRLAIDADSVDLFQFERLSEEGRTALASGNAAAAAGTLRAALALWRGPPLADLAWEPFAQSEVVRLEELRLTALENRIEADLMLGRHGQLVAELEQLVAEQPLRERLRGQLMLALYRSGRQADALMVYQRMRRTLVDELGLEPSESLRQLERAILAHDPTLAAPLARRASPRIASTATPLLGREHELVTLCDLVRRQDVRLVTLTGIGGIGKTRLGLELVRRLAPEFRNGAAVATLTPLREPAHVAQAILEALELNDAGGDPEETLTRALAASECLLLVDNFEQVLSAAPTIARLLEAAPTLKMIVTSRAPLHVAAEREFPVPPLADDEAAELFVTRAQSANPHFEVTDENAADVALLCTRLEGLPLAIELAAARTKLLSPAALLTRLGNRLALLTGGRRDAPRHQQTLRTTLDWSYDLLDPDAQLLFARLGVFAGGCTLPSAEAVCGGHGGPVLDQLATLIDESLVRSDELDGDEPRFSMLEIVREYAQERLSAAGDNDQVRRRHLEHFLALAEDAATGLTGSEQITWFARLELEHDNVRAALAYALESGDSSSALRIVVAVRRFWQIHGYLAEGRQALESVLAATPAVASELRANALNGAGILAGEQGDFEAAHAHFETALNDAHAVSATRTIANVLVNLGNLAFFRGELDRARDLYTESIEYFASLADIRGQALAKENVGLMALTAGDPAEAMTWLTSARELARDAGDDRELGAATRSLAAATLELGDAEKTTNLLTESLALAQELGEPHGIAVCLEAFAGLAATLGQVERAATLFGASDTIRASIGAQRQPDSQILYERWLARTLAQLDTKTYSTRYEDGRALTLDEACALALSAEPALVPAPNK